MWRRALLCAAVAAAIPPHHAAAICVGPDPVCARYWRADAVFIGTVTGFTCRVAEPDDEGPPGDEVHFRVVQALRDVDGGSMTLRDWVCGDVVGSESVGFREGETYFVYAYRHQQAGVLTTSSCATATLAGSRDSVAYLRTLQQPPKGGRVYGTVVLAEDDWENGGVLRRAPPEDLFVTLSGPAGSWRAAPASSGEFSFEEIPPGDYELAVTVPGPYELDGPWPIRIAAPGACAEQFLSLSWQGTLRGRALGADGWLLAEVLLSLLPAGLSAPHPSMPSYPLTTAADGEFIARRLPPGDYLVGINIGNPPTRERPYPPTWFPGVADRESAQIIRMTPAADLDVGDLLVPAPLGEVAISGRVVFADGRPAHPAQLELIDTAFPSEFAGGAWARGDGTFTIPAFAGRRYVVKATLERGMERLEARSGTIVAGDGSTVVIRLGR